MPSSAHSRSSGSLLRKAGENWFCTDTSRPPRISCACTDLVRVGVRDAGHPDLPGVQQLGERADRLGVGDLRVGPVVLVEPDRLDAEPLQRRVAGGAQVLRRAVDVPGAAAGPGVAALGGDQHVGDVTAVRRQGLGDQGLVVTDVAASRW